MSKQAPQYRLYYVDGTEEVVTRRPIHNMRAERLYGPDAGANEVMLITFWACATGGKGKMADFDKWAENLEDWEPIKAEEGDAAPLAPAPDGSLEQQ